MAGQPPVPMLMETGFPAGAYVARAEERALRALATRVINDHVDDCGLCAVCGSAFPCELAVLAEHNLDLL